MPGASPRRPPAPSGSRTTAPASRPSTGSIPPPTPRPSSAWRSPSPATAASPARSSTPPPPPAPLTATPSCSSARTARSPAGEALGTTAEILQTGEPNNVYKGTTAASIAGFGYLYSANFHSGAIDILKEDNGAPDLTGKFTDPNLPANYAPFNIQKLGDTIYVTYALQDAAGRDDVAGAGHGLVNAFDLQGNLFGRVGTMGLLNSPWGLAIAPASFGSFAGDLLVGNFGDGRINVFNPTSHAFLGQLSDASGQPIVIDGLWGLMVGNNVAGGSSDRVYFTAGPNAETHGLFGVILSVPEPSSLLLLLSGSTVVLGVGLRRRSRTAARVAGAN